MPEDFLEINRYFALITYMYCNMIGMIGQHDWPIEQCLLNRVSLGGKTKSPYLDLFIHWLIKKITNTLIPKPFFKVIRKSL